MIVGVVVGVIVGPAGFGVIAGTGQVVSSLTQYSSKAFRNPAGSAPAARYTCLYEPSACLALRITVGVERTPAAVNFAGSRSESYSKNGT